MPISGTRRMMMGSWGNFPIDIKDTSLVLYIPFGYPDSETTGSTIISKDRNRRSCTVSGATWGSQGRLFDGNDDTITIPATTSLNLRSTLTYSLWVKETNTPSVNDQIINKGNKVQIYCNPAAQIRFFLDTATTTPFVNTANLTVGVWYCVACTYDTTNGLVVYTNGAAGETAAADGQVDDTAANDIVIGAAAGSFDGRVGELLIYNRALSASEIMKVYQVTKWRYQ